MFPSQLQRRSKHNVTHQGRKITAAQPASGKYVGTGTKVLVKRRDNCGRENVSGDYVWLGERIESCGAVGGKPLGTFEA